LDPATFVTVMLVAGLAAAAAAAVPAFRATRIDPAVSLRHE
jgi:ABC-type antimicrobial peptide transport system permease subunit